MYKFAFLIMSAVIALSGCSVVLQLPSSSQYPYSSTAKETFSYEGKGINRLEVATDNGAVTVEAWNHEGIEVWVEKTGRGATKNEAEYVLRTVPVKKEIFGDKLSLLSQLGGRNNSRVDYRIKVPARMVAKASTVSGDLTIQGIEGLEGKVVSGSINAQVASWIRVKAISGDMDISLETLTENSSLEAMSGNIVLTLGKEFGGNIDTQTVSGATHWMNSGPRWKEGAYSLKIKSISGDITLKGAGKE